MTLAPLGPVASTQAYAQSEASQQESKPAEQAPTPPEQQTKPAPPEEHTSSQPPESPESKPVEQAPQLPSTTPATSPEAPASREAEPKAGEPAPSVAEPKATQAASPSKISKSKKSKRHKKARKSSTTQVSAPEITKPRKVIVRNGGTAEVISQLAPDMPTEQASHSRETTNQLLASAESNLRVASNRSLNVDQRAMVDQIRVFMEQSNAALKSGDLQRGHNLAVKALLLSKDLVKY